MTNHLKTLSFLSIWPEIPSQIKSLLSAPIGRGLVADFFSAIIWFIEFIVIPSLALCSLICIFLLLRREYLYMARKPKKEKIAAETDLFLTEIFFMDGPPDQLSVEIEQFKKHIPFGKNWCRRLVFEKILDLKRNVEDIDVGVLGEVYKGLGFDRYSNALLNRSETHAKRTALHHLRTLRLSYKKDRLTKLLNSRNKELEMQSLITLISLANNDTSFFMRFKGHISKADEINLLEIMRRNPTSVPDEPEQLLRSDNPSIVCLGLKILALTKHPFSLQKMERLMRSPHVSIRLALIDTIKQNYILLANPILMQAYKRETQSDVKIAIWAALGAVGDHRTQSFARINLIRERDFDIRYAIIDCINSLDATYFKELDTKSMPGLESVHAIVKHLNDPMLH